MASRPTLQCLQVARRTCRTCTGSARRELSSSIPTGSSSAASTSSAEAGPASAPSSAPTQASTTASDPSSSKNAPQSLPSSSFSSSPFTSQKPGRHQPGARQAHLLASLRFELSQVQPNQTRVLSRMEAVYQASPTLLTPDLLYQAIPIISRSELLQSVATRKSEGGKPRGSKGPPVTLFDRRSPELWQITQIIEHAEALYVRYRWTADRLRELGLPPQDEPLLLGWLTALVNLHYAPPAWRIWRDYMTTVLDKDGQESTTNPSLTTPQGRERVKGIAHIVLITTVRWLALKRRSLTFVDQDFAADAVEESRQILEFLRRHGLDSPVTRSLAVRIIKETGSDENFKRALQKEFDIDLDNPGYNFPLAGSNEVASAVDTEGVASSSLHPKTTIDRHTFNTVLQFYAEHKDLSKLVSMFERGAYPLPEQTYSNLLADQYSFFSSSQNQLLEGVGGGQQHEDTENALNSIESAHFFDTAYLPPRQSSPWTDPSGLSDSTTKEVAPTAATQVVPQQQDSPALVRPALRSHIPISSALVNTSSFEIVIDTAVSLGAYPVAAHYVEELLDAWMYESSQLRAMHRDLYEFDTSTLDKMDVESCQDADLPSVPLERARQPSITPSAHAILSAYKSLSTAEKRRPAMLASLVRKLTFVAEKLKDEVSYWAKVADAKSAVMAKRREIWKYRSEIHKDQQAEAQLEADIRRVTTRGRRTIHSTGDLEDPSAGEARAFGIRAHLRILRRLEVEMDSLLLRMQIKQESYATDNFVKNLLYRLSGRHTSRVSGDPIPHLENAIRRASRWLSEDGEQDKTRLANLRLHLSSLSHRELERRMATAKATLDARRAKVKQAYQDAVVALPHLIEDAASAKQLKLQEGGGENLQQLSETAGAGGGMRAGLLSSSSSTPSSHSRAAHLQSASSSSTSPSSSSDTSLSFSGLHHPAYLLSLMGLVLATPPLETAAAELGESIIRLL